MLRLVVTHTACLILIIAMSVGLAQASNFGGPGAVGNTIEDDRTQSGEFGKKLLQSWYEWKDSLQENRGISLSVDYTPLFLRSSQNGNSGENTASSGMLRFFGSWDLVGLGSKNTGSLVWKVEHRHKYADISPQAFAFDQGFVGLIEPPFSDQGERWTNLHWRQRLNDGKATILAGMLDVTDFVNVYALASPWTGFFNFVFSTGSATIFIPNDAAMGAAGGAMLSENIFIIGSLVNAYTDSTKPFDTVDNFFSDNEYFSSIELGWTKSQGRIYLDNAHLTLWHVDESDPAGTPGGWGAAFNYSMFFNDKYLPFIRGGYADDGGTLLQKSLSLGFGYNTFGGRDQLGMAFNWGEPNENSFGTGLKDQKVYEVYYRYQITQQLAITPDIQFILDPALNPTHDELWVLGLRLRLAL